MNSPHQPVLLEEVKEIFSNLSDGCFIDCTLGYGGHSEAILKQNLNLNLIAFDKDQEAIEFSTKRLAAFKNRVKIHHTNFSKALQYAEPNNISGILADIGISSLQIDKQERGFSKNSENLDMRMDIRDTKTAYDIINSYSVEDLGTIFRDFGEVPKPFKLAEKICKIREIKTIKSAKELTQIVGTHQIKNRHNSVATLVLQALRIEVNNELGELVALLKSIEANLNSKCKIAIISFHSLEDRIVKRTFKEWSKNCICPSFTMKCECGGNHALGETLTQKPIKANAIEVRENPRSRSAKMRVFSFQRSNK